MLRTLSVVGSEEPRRLDAFVPSEIGQLKKPQTDLPRIARDPRLTAVIETTVQHVPTSHRLYQHDSRDLDFIESESVHLALTSPPYWTLKEYRRSDGQLGSVADYEAFVRELDRVVSLLSCSDPRWTTDCRRRRRVPVQAQERRAAHSSASTRLDSRTLSFARVRQPRANHLAQDRQRRLRSRKRRWWISRQAVRAKRSHQERH